VAERTVPPIPELVDFDAMELSTACEQALGWMQAGDGFRSQADSYTLEDQFDWAEYFNALANQSSAAERWLAGNGQRC
jgi:hypothetical protein